MDFGAVHNFALPSVGPNAAQCLDRALRGAGTTRCPVQSSSWGQRTPASLGGTCFGQLLEKKAAWKGQGAKPQGDASFSCLGGATAAPEGSSGDEAHSSQQLPREGGLLPLPTAPQAATANILPSSLPERQQDAELSTIALLTQQIYGFSIKSPVS